MDYKENNKHLFYLKLVYIWLLVLFFCLWIIDVTAKIRTVLLFAAFAPVVITHALIAMKIDARATNKRFFFFSLLWVGKIFFFIVTDGIHFFFQQTILILDLVDIFLMLMIAFLSSISLIVRNPFFYKRIESRTIVFAGIAGLFLTIFAAIIIALSFFDFFWEPLIRRI